MRGFKKVPLVTGPEGVQVAPCASSKGSRSHQSVFCRSLNELPAEARDKWSMLGWGTVPGKGTSRANEDLRGRLEQNPGSTEGLAAGMPALLSTPCCETGP